MSAPVAVARLDGRACRLLVARSGAGGLAVQAFDEGPADRLGAFAKAAGVDQAYLLLEPGVATLVRAEAETPVRRTVTSDTIAEALEASGDAIATDGIAILSRRPYAYTADGEPVDEAPLGQPMRRLGVEIAALTASVSTLGRLDRSVRAQGLGLTGVVAMCEGLAAALLPEGEGTAICVERDGTLAVQVRSGVVIGQAHVPIGRRHLEGDLAQSHALEPDEAARKTDAVLSGTSSDDRAIGVIGARLAELSDLLQVQADKAGLSLGGAVLSGLPPNAASKIASATAAGVTLPREARHDPALVGAALLALGQRGGLDRASLPTSKSQGLMGWLRRRF